MVSNLEISKEEYDGLRKLNHRDMSKKVANIVTERSEWHPLGYGCWGEQVTESEGKYLVVWSHSNNCD